MKCETCRWWVAQHALSEEEYCHLNPAQVLKSRDSWCSHWVANEQLEITSRDPGYLRVEFKFTLDDVWKQYEQVLRKNATQRCCLTGPDIFYHNKGQVYARIDDDEIHGAYYYRICDEIGQEIWL